MGMYYLKSKCFSGVALGKITQADNLLSSYLDVSLCHSGQLDKERKVFNIFSNNLFIGDIAKRPFVA